MSFLERLLLLLALLVPNIILISNRESPYLPGIFVILFYSEFLVLVAVCYSAGIYCLLNDTFDADYTAILFFEVFADYCSKSKRLLPSALVINFVIFIVKSCMRVYEFVYDLHSSFGPFLTVINILSCTIFIFHTIYWTHLTVKDLKRRCTTVLTLEENRCIVYTPALVALSLWGMISGFIWPYPPWQSVQVQTLVAFFILEILLVAILTGNVVKLCRFDWYIPLHPCALQYRYRSNNLSDLLCLSFRLILQTSVAHV